NLTENSAVILDIPKEDVAKITREGNSAVISLRNGETIVIQNFFNNENTADNSLAFVDDSGQMYWAEFTDANGAVTDTIKYHLIDDVEPLLYNDDNFAGLILPWLGGAAAIGGIAAAAGGGDDDNNNNNNNGGDTTPPAKPEINPINPKDPITGTGEAGGEVTVTYPDGSTVTTIVGEDGTWEVENPGNLEDGDEVTAEAKDPAGNVSDKDKEIVDGIAPTTPSIDPINPKDPITGTGETGSEITVTYPDGSTVTTIVGEDGTWEVENPGNLEDGDEVTAEAKDPAGNVSDKDKEIVDGIAPTAPQIDPIGPKSPQITGTAEPNAKITVTYPDGTTATTTAGSDGKWSVPTPPNLKDGDEVKATAKDPAGNVSDEGKEIVDGVGPITTLNPVNLKDPITGTGEPDSTIKVTYPNGTTVTTTVNADGKWTVPNPGLQNGDEVKAVGTDKVGNIGPEVTDLVEGQLPPQPQPNAPSIDPIGPNLATITGKAEAGNKITVSFPDGTSVTTTAGADGKWSITTPQGLKDGDVVKAIATNANGTQSNPDTEIVDGVGPTTTIDPINAIDPITGTGEPGSSVKVTYPNGDTETTTVKSDGTWQVSNPGLEDGDIVTAVGTDSVANVGPEVTEQFDGVGPATEIDPIGPNLAEITGTGEPGATVTVTYPDNSTATTEVGSDGTWSVTTPPGLKDGDVVTAQSKDPQGNLGAPNNETVDGIGPTTEINPIGPNTPVGGTGEPGATIEVTFPNGDTETTTVKEDGTWSVANPGLEDGDIVTAIGTDKVGNQGPQATEQVDGILPITDIDPIGPNLAEITGTGLAGAIVTVTFPDGSTATATIDADGEWSVANPGNLKDGDEVTAVSSKLGNTGPIATETVDGVGPTTEIDPINAIDPITGTGEPGSSVEVTYPDGTSVTTQVDADGNWTVANPGLNDGDEVKAIGTDPVGNVG
ncbi:BapA prefix-like domain-containing protein, partial [Acinetobacter sp. 187]|uniref:Ig-like domain-containing protein n=1 Tax=Acinetobacter lanii TaxID=2715163 RepID=UPI0014097AE6